MCGGLLRRILSPFQLLRFIVVWELVVVAGCRVGDNRPFSSCCDCGGVGCCIVACNC
jgi:hypothetical protein